MVYKSKLPGFSAKELWKSSSANCRINHLLTFVSLNCVRFLILKSGFRQAEHYIQLTTLCGIIS